MPLTPAQENDVRRMIADWRRYGIKKSAASPLALTESADGQIFTLTLDPTVTPPAALTQVVPLALIAAVVPTGCDDADAGAEPYDRVDQCWGPYYYAVIVTWDAACGAWTWADGNCVFLLSVTGQKLVLGQRYPGWLIGDPPDDIKGAGVPIDFPCESMTAAPLYAAYSRESRTVYVGNPYPKCPTPGTLGYVQLYEATELVWGDCDGWVTVGTGYVCDVNGCELTPGRTVDGQFERMLAGDEVGGAARECVPLYTYERPKNQQIDLRCEGGSLNLYAPDQLDPCGDDLVFVKTVACCDASCGGGGGGGQRHGDNQRRRMRQ